MITNTTATRKIFALKKRIRAISGGTGASKTISILIWCIDYCQSNKNKLVSVVSESYPHLERGAMLDFEVIMKDRGYWNDDRWNRTKHTYEFETGSKMEFFSPDTYGKAHGPRRDVLFANECNNIEWKIIDQLIVRTREVVLLDWNPVSEFWYYTEVDGKRDDVDFLKLTYLDNEALDEISRKEIESRRHRKDWWRVYGEGELGELEGIIYKDWKTIDDIPHEARLERHGLDFGYHPDPAAIADVYYWNGAYILDEQLYQKGMSNADLAGFIKNLEEKLTIADAAEPKSIDELKGYGISILPSVKGADSKRSGIKFVQAQKIYITKRSVNLIKEYRNYLWKVDKDGRIVMGETDERCKDHLLDAVRYALTSLISAKQDEEHRQALARYAIASFHGSGGRKPNEMR